MYLPANIGKYELLQFLGGGMSHVYRARDSVIGRIVAVKFLTEVGCADLETKTRFLAEAQIAGNIRHDNIIEIFDFGEDERHGPYMVMEFLEGEDLLKAIKHGHTGNIKEKLKIALQVARALEHIHTRRIIHRDIKPENIHVNSNGKVKLMDFGIAKCEGPSLTRVGYVLGTPRYMAPEQVLGQDITGQVDVYAFGLLLFELTTGVKPISNDSMERMFYIILNEPLNLEHLKRAGVPQAVSDLVAKCTSKDRAGRPESFVPICTELERIAASLEAPEKVPTAILSAQSPQSSRRTNKQLGKFVAFLAGVALLLSLGFLVERRNLSGTAEPISTVEAEYTREALAAHLEGAVALEAIIDKDGSVQDVRVVKPAGKGLDESAVRAFRQWRFRPASRNGSPVPSRIQMTFTFHLN
jgi:serine/threonine-protein kinase